MKASQIKLIAGGAVVLTALTFTLFLNQKPKQNQPSLQQKIALLDYMIETEPGNQAQLSSNSPSDGGDQSGQVKKEGLELEFYQIYKKSYMEIVDYLLNRASDTRIQNPEKMLGIYLDQMSRVYYRADVASQEFDAEIRRQLQIPESERIESMMDHPIYRTKLLPYWIIKDRIGTQIKYVLLRLLIIESSQTYGPETGMPEQNIRAAQSMLNYTRQIWNHIANDDAESENYKMMNRLVRYAAQDLFHDIGYAVKTYIDDHRDAFGSLPPANLSEFLVLTNRIAYKDEADQKSWEREIRQDLANMVNIQKLEGEAERQLPADSPLSWVSVIQRELSLQLRESTTAKASSREPNAAGKFCPDAANSRGNIVGNEFPQGIWAMTLDDGPHATHSGTILNAFESTGTKGTFFWLAQLTGSKNNQDVIKAIKAAGHDLANHSFSHANLPKLNSASLDKEINTSTDVHSNIYGYSPKFFRCPYGACGPTNSPIRQRIAKKGMIHAFWNIDTLDWKDKNVEILLERTKNQIQLHHSKKRGGMILFHDIHQTSAATIKELLPWMKANGYQVKPLSEIVRTANAGTEGCGSWTPDNQ